MSEQITLSLSLLSGNLHSSRGAGVIKELSTYRITVQVNAMKGKHKHSEKVSQRDLT